MKHYRLMIVLLLLNKSICLAQNVGIGIATPLYKLDVAGFVRNSSTAMTSPGLFGRLTAGGSLRIENSDNSKFIVIDGGSMQAQLGSLQSSGTSASQLLINPYGGNVGIGIVTANATLTVARGKGGDGTAAFAGTDHVSHFNYSNGESTYIRGGKNGSNVFINDSHSGDVNIATGGGNINTGNGIYSTQTGGLNIVPIGVISYKVIINSGGSVTQMNITNDAGTIATGTYNASATTLSDDAIFIDFDLNNDICNQYSKVVAVGSNSFDNRNFGEGRACNSSFAIIIKENGVSLLRIGYASDSFSLVDPELYGSFVLYGIK